MISANEARNKAENIINSCATKELSEIMEQIEYAIENGKFSICGNGYLQTITKQKLEDLGYKIKTGMQYNEDYYSVSW